MDTPQSNRAKRRRGGTAFVGSALLLVLCLLALSACGATPGGRQYVTLPGPLPTPTQGPSQAVTLQDVHMLDEQNGWAVTQDKQVLHTTTGAENWRGATPSTGDLKYTLGAYNFLDVQNAWVAMQSGDKFSIFHTYNGGGLWLETPLLDAGNGVQQISFADSLNGWLLFDKGISGQGQAVDVFHTTDGGNSWLLISGVSSNTGDQQGSLPFSGRKNGISFHSATTGWVTGSNAGSKSALLYMTSDAGFSWTPQTLALPSGMGGTITTFPPQFANATDGILPVMFSDGNKVVVYLTHDGGKTWSSGNVSTDISTTIALEGDNQAWAIGSGANAGNVYASSDGGRTWRQLTRPDATSGKLVSLSLVSATRGWLLAAINANTTRLFQTTDGGKSWARLNTTASF